MRVDDTGQAVVAQPIASQHGERKEPLGVPVIAHPQPPTPRQPGDRALRLPAMAAQPLRRVDPTAGDADLDPSSRQVAPAAAMIVGLVRVDLLRAAAPLACWRAHRGDVVQQRLEHGAVACVGRGHQQRQRQPAAVNRQVQPAPGLGSVDRVCANVVPSHCARLKLSTLTRDQSSTPAAPSSSSSSSCSRSNTPRGPTRQTVASSWSRCRSRTHPLTAAPTASRSGP
jgi:hypothetical protein